MGLSSSKTTTGPSKQALPYLQQGSAALTSAYNANNANDQAIGNALTTAFKNYSVDNPTLTAANQYTQDVLGGKYLDAGNPYLKGIIDSTNSDITDQINALFSNAGQTGSSRQIGELGKQLANSENNLRYTDYNNELARMDGAVGNAATLNNATNSNLSTLANLGTTAATVPYIGAQTLANGLGGLWGNSTTTTSSPSLGQMLLGAASNAAAGWASGGFKT